MIPQTEPLGLPLTPRRSSTTATSQSITLSAGIRGVSLLAVGQAARFVISIGAPTASATTSHYIAAGERLDFRVPLGAPSTIAVIRDTAASADGAIEITELG